MDPRKRRYPFSEMEKWDGWASGSCAESSSIRDRAVGSWRRPSRICEEMTTESRMTLARRTPRGRRTLTFWGVCFSVHTFPPSRVDVGAASKCVGLLHKTALAVVDVEVVLEKEFRPPGLPPGEDLFPAEPYEAFVVSKDECFVRSAFEVLAPMFERVDYGVQFFVVDFVVPFG